MVDAPTKMKRQVSRMSGGNRNTKSTASFASSKESRRTTTRRFKSTRCMLPAGTERVVHAGIGDDASPRQVRLWRSMFCFLLTHRYLDCSASPACSPSHNCGVPAGHLLNVVNAIQNKIRLLFRADLRLEGLRRASQNCAVLPRF
jgi:hypothetical protein